MSLLMSMALAGAWTRDLGDGYVRGGADSFVALTQPDRPQGPADFGDGEVQSYQVHSASIYAEVGVLPGGWGQVHISAPFGLSSQKTVLQDSFGSSSLRAETTRVGDVRTGLQLALHPRWPLSLSAEIKVPGYRNGAIGKAYPLYRDAFPKPGDGQIDVSLLAEGALSGAAGFCEAGVGVVHRTEAFVGWSEGPNFSDGLRARLKAGTPVGRVWPIVGTDALVSPAPTPVTRSSVAVWATLLASLGRGFALEPRVATDLWVARAARGASAGIGLSYTTPQDPPDDVAIR